MKISVTVASILTNAIEWLSRQKGSALSALVRGLVGPKRGNYHARERETGPHSFVCTASLRVHVSDGDVLVRRDVVAVRLSERLAPSL